MMATQVKRAVSGAIAPRWPKPRVVRWLELGAVPAIVGLWFPDWVGGYSALARGASHWYAFPPVLVYVGALVLLQASRQGVKRMGRHYRGVLAAGSLAVALAVASVGLHVAIPLAPGPLLAATLAAIVLAFFFATGFLWFTIGKVAEITTELRVVWTWRLIALTAPVALLLGLTAAWLVLEGQSGWPAVLRASVVATSASFLLCRFGVHCYKTQRSIGATFTKAPQEQFWV